MRIRSKNPYIIFLQFCRESVKRMKHRNANASIKILHILDDNRPLRQSLMSTGCARPPDFNKPSAPPPTLQKISILSHKTFTAFSNASYARLRAIPSDGIQRGLFLLSYFPLLLLFFSRHCCAPRVATFRGNEI